VKSRRTFIKLFLEHLAFMLLVMAVAGGFVYHRLEADYQTLSRRNQQQLTEMAAAYFRELWPMDDRQVDQACKSLFDGAARLTIVAPDGRVLGDSDAAPAEMANHKTPDRPEVINALSGVVGDHQRLSRTFGADFRYMALPLIHNGNVVGAVRVSMPVTALAEGKGFIRQTMLWAALVGTFGAAAMAALTTWMWYSPLRRISHAARKIASGDLSARLALQDDRGLGDLWASLDEMRNNLGMHLAQIAAQHQDLQAVISNLEEGVLAIDSSGCIAFVNPAAASMLRVDEKTCIGKALHLVVRSLDVLELHERMQTKPDEQPRWAVCMSAGERKLDVRAVRVAPGASHIQSLLVIRDITELAAAAAMKAQFVANASHELRTPLATIRVAVDSLASVEPLDHDEHAKLVGMLDRHVNRMEEMINDLLDLHLVESSRYPIQPRGIALDELANWARGQFAQQAADKGVSIEIGSGRAGHSIRGDRKLIELIMRNLLDNAIKFTPSGGSVHCEFVPDEGGAIIRVSDTGCGIKPSDQLRVFERFFQSDSAKSGDARTRGTGLGLAIVKHAAECIGADVRLESEQGKGTVVTVRIKSME
jgi:two-component system phosphate regulon sensor histidine kinase PhoR